MNAFTSYEHLFAAICGKEVFVLIIKPQFAALNILPAVAHEAYSECKDPQRDVLALPGTFGVDPENAIPKYAQVNATAAYVPGRAGVPFAGYYWFECAS